MSLALFLFPVSRPTSSAAYGCLLLIPAAEIGKCVACLRNRWRDAAPLPPPCNQQPHARENRIPRPSPIERRTIAQSPTERFSFSIFSPRSPSRSPCSPALIRPSSPYAISSRLPRLIFDHRGSFVRGVMGVPLLSGREHARKKIGKKSSPLSRPPVRSFHISSARFLSPFFNRSNFSGSVPPRCPCNHLYSDRTCPPCAVSEIFRTGPDPIPASSELIHESRVTSFEESRRYTIKSRAVS